ncbi:phospholipase D-like domain-containing protein, partial [Acidithiobacillus sp.]
KYWRVQIRRRGYLYLSATFDTEAMAWALTKEAELERQTPEEWGRKYRAIRLGFGPKRSSWYCLRGSPCRGFTADFNAPVHVRLMPKRPVYIHAKAEISSYYAFVGSENYSVSSLEENREMGLILNNPTDISMLQAQFARDWQAAGAA